MDISVMLRLVRRVTAQFVRVTHHELITQRVLSTVMEPYDARSARKDTWGAIVMRMYNRV